MSDDASASGGPLGPTIQGKRTYAIVHVQDIEKNPQYSATILLTRIYRIPGENGKAFFEFPSGINLTQPYLFVRNSIVAMASAANLSFRTDVFGENSSAIVGVFGGSKKGIFLSA